MAVSVAQAALNTLAAYLTANLTGGVTVRSHWPGPNAAATARSLTAIQAGVVQYDLCSVQALATVNQGAAQTAATWAVYQCRMPLQLDIWATSDFARDDLRAQLQTWLNKGTSIVSTNQDPAAEGVSLNFLAADGYTGLSHFICDDATLIDSPDAYQRSEYRATVRGEARFVQTAATVGPRLVSIAMKAKVHEAPTAVIGSLFDIVTVLPAGGTSRTTGP